MGELFASQRDYLYFCAGALFVILAVTSGTAQRLQRDKIPWLWLMLFANISAAGKWMNLVWLSMGDTPLFSSARQVTVSAAFVCLLVFADRTLAATGVVRRWQRVLLLCGGCLVLGFGVWMFHGGHGVRWMLNVSSTVWAAAALWLVARRATHGRHALLLVSYAMAGYCVCTACGIFQENMTPVLTLARHDIFSRIGAAIKSCDIACIAAMIMGMALYCKEPATAARDMPLASCPCRALMRLALVLLLVVGTGWFLTVRAGQYAHTLQARSLLSRAELAANAWEGGLAERLTGSAADNTNPVYHLMKRRLMRMRMVAPDVRFIYLMSRHGTAIVFNVDSEPATSADCSPAGQVYTEASPEIYRTFSTRAAFVGGPLQDRRGTWVSAYTPLPATSAAATMMVLGMDVAITEWRRALAVYRLVPISITALVILLLVGFFTNREQMRQATQHRLHELRLVLDYLPGSAFMKDCQGRYLMANRSFCEAMGHPLHAILGQTDFVLLPDTAEMFTREDQQVIATGQPLLIGGADLLDAGNAATVTTRKVPLRNEHGDVVGIVGLTFDMREHKRAMTALRESEEKHRILLACIQSPVLALNRDAIILYCNDAYTQAVNTPASALVGRALLDVFPQFGRTASYAALRACLQTGAAQHVEGWWGPRYYRARSYPTPDGVLSVLDDITESRQAGEALRESEARFCALAELSGTVAWEVDDQGLFIYVSHVVEQVLGYRPDELVGMKYFYDLHPEAERAAFKAAALEVFARKAPFRNLKNAVQTKDGRLVWLTTNGSPLLHADGTLRGYRGSDTDITERTQAEDKIQRYATELERSNSELEHFAYIASHDLQEPLRMISSYLQLIERRYKGKLDADADTFIGFAVDGANRLREMVTGLLQYARVHSQGKPLQQVALEEVLAQALAHVKLACDESGAVVTHAPLPQVQGDAAQLTQLLQNLMSNAVKFRGEAAPRVQLDVTTTPAEWCISVRDNGIGFDPAQADKLFMLFRRLHGRKYPGSGIGLALCRRIVERHGGRIWAESQLGAGTCIHFTLPRSAAQPQPHDEPAPTAC